MITGNGTAESHYIISGDSVKEVWDDMLLKIKENGVYVDLDQAYTFDIDELYKGSVVPDGIEIGYGTILDGKGSDLKSETLKAETFDFEGKYATVKDFLLLPYKETYPDNYLEIVDTAEKWLSKITETHASGDLTKIKKIYGYSNNDSTSYASLGRLKCTPNITIDFNNESTYRSIYNGNYYYTDYNNPRFRIYQCENLTIKKHRNLYIEFCSNYKGNNYSQQEMIKRQGAVYNLNVIDCYREAGSNVKVRAYTNVYRECHFVLHNNTTNNYQYYFFEPNVNSDGSANPESNANLNCPIFDRCVIECYSNGSVMLGTVGNFNYPMFNDCIIKLDNVRLIRMSALKNSYMYGTISCPNNNTISFDYGSINSIVNVDILTDTKVSWYSTASNQLSYSLAVAKTDEEKFSNMSNARGITFLTTEEIRNSVKLYEAGIPINPNRTAE